MPFIMGAIVAGPLLGSLFPLYASQIDFRVEQWTCKERHTRLRFTTKVPAMPLSKLIK